MNCKRYFMAVVACLFIMMLLGGVGHGVCLTAAAQSSSVTTSLVIPLVLIQMIQHLVNSFE